MRAVVHDRFGLPADVLTLGERPLPEPGPGQIRVRLTLAPIHNHDLWTIRGSYGVKPPLPAIAGSEAAGVVDKLGDGVGSVVVGQRVMASGLSAAWAEYFVCDAARVIPLPDAIDDVAGCQLIAMPLSAFTALEEFGLQPGDWLVQNAAAGAVGKIIDQVATARGVHVLNLVRRPSQVDALKAAGTHHAVATEGDGWKDAARALIADGNVRAAIDSVAGTASADVLELLGNGGHLMSFGSMSGEPMTFSAGLLIFKQATLKGFWGAKSIPALTAETRGRLIGEILRMVATGTLKLPADGIYDLADAAKAAAASDTPGRTGKVLLRA